MKEIFLSYAKYNKAANEEMLKLIEPLDREIIMRKTKAFYPSIFDTLSHILFTDINWIKRFKEVFTDNQLLNKTHFASMETENLKKELGLEYTRLFQCRKELDEIILQFIDGLDDEKLGSAVSLRFKNPSGDFLNIVLWKALIQWFNHQTHHRGQVSIQLDMVEVYNDYSSFLKKT